MCLYWRSRLLPFSTPRGGIALASSRALTDVGLGALALVHALGELLDDLGLERFQVFRFAAGDQSLVDVDFLVDPVGAGVAEVGLQARPGGEGAAPAHPTAVQGPGAWEIQPTRLAGPEKPPAEPQAPPFGPRWAGVGAP